MHGCNPTQRMYEQNRFAVEGGLRLLEVSYNGIIDDRTS
jgi:hypothetical protein